MCDSYVWQGRKLVLDKSLHLFALADRSLVPVPPRLETSADIVVAIGELIQGLVCMMFPAASKFSYDSY